MRLGIPYVITNTVVEFEENRLIALAALRWATGGATSSSPTDGGTRVRETYDWSTAILGTRLYIVATGWPEAGRAGHDRRRSSASTRT